MSRVLHLVIVILIALATAAPPAQAAHCGNRGATYAEALKAKAEARAAAERALAKARALAEQRAHERRWLRRWHRAYGRNVGRWADDAIRAGWPDRQLWTLGRIIRAESGGNPRAYNPSGCSGLLQLAPCWYSGRWDFNPYDPRLNLRYGLRVWRLCGWRAWITW